MSKGKLVQVRPLAPHTMVIKARVDGKEKQFTFAVGVSGYSECVVDDDFLSFFESQPDSFVCGDEAAMRFANEIYALHPKEFRARLKTMLAINPYVTYHFIVKAMKEGKVTTPEITTICEEIKVVAAEKIETSKLVESPGAARAAKILAEEEQAALKEQQKNSADTLYHLKAAMRKASDEWKYSQEVNKAIQENQLSTAADKKKSKASESKFHKAFDAAAKAVDKFDEDIGPDGATFVAESLARDEAGTAAAKQAAAKTAAAAATADDTSEISNTEAATAAAEEPTTPHTGVADSSVSTTPEEKTLLNGKQETGAGQ